MVGTVAGAGGHRRSAARFFWGWLVVATLMSVAGNLAHAVLIAPADTRWLAAVAALVPPAVLISTNHSMSMLVRTRAGGAVYWIALAATVLLAAGAFVLSFDALRSVAIVVGTRPAIAWIWPAVIDVAIAHATLCLLSLSRPQQHSPALCPPPAACPAEPVTPDAVTAPAPAATEEPAPVAAVVRSPAVAVTGGAQWRDRAESVLAATRLRQPPELVAAVLAQRASGKRPGTIASDHQIPHSTVQRILAAANRVLGSEALRG